MSMAVNGAAASQTGAGLGIFLRNGTSIDMLDADGNILRNATIGTPTDLAAPRSSDPSLYYVNGGFVKKIKHSDGSLITSSVAAGDSEGMVIYEDLDLILQLATNSGKKLRKSVLSTGGLVSETSVSAYARKIGGYDKLRAYSLLTRQDVSDNYFVDKLTISNGSTTNIGSTGAVAPGDLLGTVGTNAFWVFSNDIYKDSTQIVTHPRTILSGAVALDEDKIFVLSKNGLDLYVTEYSLSGTQLSDTLVLTIIATLIYTWSISKFEDKLYIKTYEEYGGGSKRIRFIRLNKATKVVEVNKTAKDLVSVDWAMIVSSDV